MRDISTRNYIKVSESALREYQNKNAIKEVIGCLAKNPQLLKTFKFDKRDFVDSYQQIIYVTIHNMAREGAEKIDGYIIDSYLKESFPLKHSVYTKHQGIKYVQEASNFASLENFFSNYNEVRKWSLLRTLVRSGIDVTEYYDPEETDIDLIEYRSEKFREDSVDDIINFYRGKILNLNNLFSTKQGRDSVKAGSKEAEAQKEAWKEAIDYGLSYASNYLNTVTYGIRKKRFTVMSAGTGTGKII